MTERTYEQKLLESILIEQKENWWMCIQSMFLIMFLLCGISLLIIKNDIWFIGMLLMMISNLGCLLLSVYEIKKLKCKFENDRR